MVNHMEAPRPSPPSLFPPAVDLSLQAGPDEPLFRQYSREIQALLAPGEQSEEVQQWRSAELASAAEVMREEVDAFASSSYGRV